MIVLTCIKKNRDLRGKLVNFLLVDNCNNKILMDSSNLRLNMKSEYIEVTNLKLSNDGRIINK